MLAVIITSSVLISAIALLRTALKSRVSAVFTYSLWLLAALRLLLPVELSPSHLSVMNVLPDRLLAAETPEPQAGLRENEVVVPDTLEGDEIKTPVVTEADSVTTPRGAKTTHYPGNAEQRPDTQTLLTAIWLLGASLMAVSLFAVNGLMYFKLRGERRRVEVPGVRLRVYLVDNLPSPCLFGLLHPSIYISGEVLRDEEHTHMVLLHEQTHYSHGDYIWALLRCVLLCIYWFDPFVWVAAYLSRVDAELACDESCIKSLGLERRIDYGSALIDMLAHQAKRTGLLQTATTMSGGKRTMRERIRRIAKVPRTKFAAAVMAAIVILAVTACTFTGARNADLVTDLDAYLANPTAFARMPDGEIVDNDTGHSYEIGSNGTLLFHYRDNQTVDVALPATGCPGAFMSDTVAALSFVDDGTLLSWVSRDRGEDWYTQTEIVSGLPAGGYTLTGFSTANDGWVLWASSAETSQSVRVWLTEDGGENWAEVPEVYMRLGEQGNEGIITGFAVSPTGTAYAAVSRNDGSSYFTWNTNVTSPLYGINFTSDAGKIDGLYIANTPLVAESGVEFVYTTPNGLEIVNNEHVEGNWHIPEPWTGEGEFIDLPGGVHVAMATDALLAQFWDTLTLTSEGFTAETEIVENTVLLYVEDKLDYCGVFDIEGDIAWLAPEDVSIDHHLTYVPNAAVLINLTLDEYGHSQTGIRTHNNDYSNYNEYAYRLDIVDGRLTATPTGLGYDTDSNTVADTGQGLLLDYTDSSTAAVYMSTATVYAGGDTGISLCAREDIRSLYVVALDYSGGYTEPFEGERLYSTVNLGAGQSLTICTDLSAHGGFGFIFVGSDGNPHWYYLNTSAAATGGVLDIQTMPHNTPK